MAFNDNTVKAKEYSPVDSARIHLGLHPCKGMAREQIADFRKNITAERLAHILPHLTGRAFRCFYGDVAGKAFGDNDIDCSLAYIIALNESMIDEIWQLPLAQQARRGLNLIDALDLLDANIQQTDSRPRDGKNDPSHR